MIFYFVEFESIAEQEWIVFQKKLHLLDEFVKKWKGNLEPYTVVTLFLQQELEKYSVRQFYIFIWYIFVLQFNNFFSI